MTKSQLEMALRQAGKIARDRDFIVFGSQCILGTVSRPPRTCLASQELDLYPRGHPQAVMLLVQKLGPRSAFSRREGFFVDCVTPDLAAIPEGWTDRLIPFSTRQTAGVTGWCLELHDLAASKLAAGRKKDLDYVRALFGHGLITARILRERLRTLPVSSSSLRQIEKALPKILAGARKSGVRSKLRPL
jgi:hypothetical protein